MKFAKFINENNIEYAPKTCQVTITNLPNILESNITIQTLLDYHPVNINREPDYNPETQYLQEVYSVQNKTIVIDYVVKEMNE